MNDVHESFMSYAIELAKKGRGGVSPNPLVGCVIVKNGEIIGEGFHKEFGKEHAEVDAFNNCSQTPEGADLYVNLEPCSIFSKTSPCVDRIIENGIKNVYVGTKDFNPSINGSGIDKLEKARINVFQNILEKECYELNKGFFKWIDNGKPWVIVKIAQSNNGYMGIDSKTSTWITGEDVKVNSHKLRSKVDGILIGRTTAEVDNPQLTVRKVNGNNPIRVIVDTYRQLPLNLNLFTDNLSENIILCSKDKFKQSKTVNSTYLPIKEEDGLLSPCDILNQLGEYGMNTLLIEGGQKIISSFLNENLVDEVYLYTSKNNLENAYLETPFELNQDWEVIKEENFEKDALLIARKKELCLQVL